MKTLRVDHVGSLLRPEYLKDAFKRYALREISHQELRAIQDRAIREVVRREQSIGLPVITDGEYRRLNWQVSFSEVEGWDMWRTSWDNFERNPENRAPGENVFHRLLGSGLVQSALFFQPGNSGLEFQWRRAGYLA